MEKFKLSDNIDSNKIFIVNSSEIEGRLDVDYNSHSIRCLVNKIKSKKFIKLIDIVEPIKNGSTPPEGKFEEKGIKYYRSQDFSLYDFVHNQYISEEFNRKIIRSYVKKEDVLLAVVGATLGKVGYVYSEKLEGNINQNVARIRINYERFISEYIAIFLSSNVGQKLIQRYATITTQAYLNNQQLGSIPIPLIDIKKQKIIISIIRNAYIQKQEKEAEAQRLLDSIDDYLLGELGIVLSNEDDLPIIEPNNQYGFSLDTENPLVKNGRLFLTSIKQVSGGRLDPDYFLKNYTDLKAVIQLANYPLGRLSDYCDGIYSGQTPASSEYSNEESNYPIIKVSSYSNDNIDLNKLAYAKNKQNYYIQKGDIFILSAAHQAEYVGKHIKYLEETPKIKTSFVGELLCIRTDDKRLLSNYLFPLLNTNIYKTLINREKTGQTSHIYAKDIKKLRSQFRHTLSN